MQAALERFERSGHAILRSGRWHLTPEGFLLSNQIIGQCLEALADEKLRREEADREIQSLQLQLERKQANMLLSQISSHFFYHTLNALQALIVLKPDAAYKMAGDFARYLRFNLDTITAEGGVVSFKEELRAVRAYVDINREQLVKLAHPLLKTDYGKYLLQISEEKR